MVEPVAYADVIAHLRRHSRRPLVAMELFTRLFSYLPPDGNEVLADRAELARVVGCTPTHVSEIMGELEAVGAVYRRREGRGVRYFVNPRSARTSPAPPATAPRPRRRRSSCGWSIPSRPRDAETGPVEPRRRTPEPGVAARPRPARGAIGGPGRPGRS